MPVVPSEPFSRPRPRPRRRARRAAERGGAVITENEIWSLAVRAAEAKKALDVLVLDLRNLSPLTDYFVICSAASRRQLRALLDAIREALREKGYRLRHQEGDDESHWLLLDYGDMVVHIFDRESRSFYALDRLWQDAPVLYSQRGELA